MILSTMSLCPKLVGLPIPWSPSFSSNLVKFPNIPTLHFSISQQIGSYLRPHGISAPFFSSLPKLWPPKLNPRLQFCSLDSDSIDVHSLSDDKSLSSEEEGPTEKKPYGGQGVLPKSNEMVEKLRRYGVAGLLSYGLLNTAYYSTTFLLVWFYVSPAPGKMGYLAAVERFVKVMAMVWAGSQVTKIVRAGGALALAPFVDRGLSWFTAKFNFKSQGQAFAAIVAFCLGLAVLLFFTVTLLSA